MEDTWTERHCMQPVPVCLHLVAINPSSSGHLTAGVLLIYVEKSVL